MDEPVDYGELGAYLAETRGLPTVGIRTPYHSTWLDNTKAKFLLGWRPQYDLKRMIDAAWDYERAPTTRASSGTRAETSTRRRHGRHQDPSLQR